MKTLPQLLVCAGVVGGAVGAFLDLEGRTAGEPVALPAARAPASRTPGPGVLAVSPFGAGPARYEPNLGQAPEGTRWLRRGPREVVHLHDDGFTTVVQARGFRAFADAAPEAPRAVRIVFAGGAARPRQSAHDTLACRTHVFVGRDPSGWVRDIPNHARVTYDDVWPGIDAVFHGRDGRTEYDFVVAPGADADAIALEIAGADSARIDDRGDLVFAAGAAEIVHSRPFVYQDAPSGRRVVACDFELETPTRVRFRLAGRDPSLPTVIDPEIGVRFGGVGSDAPTAAAALRSANGVNIRLGTAGLTVGAGLVGVGPLAGAPGGSNGFVAIHDTDAPDPNVPVALAILGGAGDDGCTGVGFDASGDLHVSCYTTDVGDFGGLGPLDGATLAGLGGVDGVLLRISGDGDAIEAAAPWGGPGTDLLTDLEVRQGGNATHPAVYAGALSDSASLPGAPGLPAGRNALVCGFGPDGAPRGAFHCGTPGFGTSAPVRVSVDEDRGFVWAATAGAAGGFTTTPGVLQPARSGLAGFVVCVAGDLTARRAATFFPGQLDLSNVQVAALPTGDVAVSGSFLSGDVSTTPNRAFPDVAGFAPRGAFAVLTGNVTHAHTISHVGGPGFTSVADVLPAPAGNPPFVILLGSSNGLPAFGDGSAYPGTPGVGAPEPWIGVLPAFGGSPTFGSYVGSPATEGFGVQTASGRGIDFGRRGVVLPDGRLLIVLQTNATAGQYPGVAGEPGGGLDAVLRTLETGLTVPGGGGGLAVETRSASVSLPKTDGGLGKAAFTLRMPSLGGPADLGIGGDGALEIAVEHPASGAAPLLRARLPLDAGRTESGGRAMSWKLTLQDGTRVVVRLDGRRLPVQVAATFARVPALPTSLEGTALTGVPLRFGVALNGASGTSVGYAQAARGGRRLDIHIEDFFHASLAATPASGPLGSPTTLTATFENAAAAPQADVPFEIRHNGVPILMQTVTVPGRDPATLLAGSRTVTTTATPPKAGRNHWDLLLGGKVVSTVRTTTRK